MAKKDELGRRGESVAAEWFEHDGYRIIDRNWRSSQGEIDLIVTDEETLVFVEVKTRSSLGYGHPFEAITPRKCARLRRLTGLWAQQSLCAVRPELIRIDGVAVMNAWTSHPTIEHITGIA